LTWAKVVVGHSVSPLFQHIAIIKIWTPTVFESFPGNNSEFPRFHDYDLFLGFKDMSVQDFFASLHLSVRKKQKIVGVQDFPKIFSMIFLAYLSS
jgi:hypothetical protein